VREGGGKAFCSFLGHAVPLGMAKTGKACLRHDARVFIGRPTRGAKLARHRAAAAGSQAGMRGSPASAGADEPRGVGSLSWTGAVTGGCPTRQQAADPLVARL